MCYPPPGPRCSDHAHKELLHALKEVAREDDVNRKILLQLKVDEAQKNFYTTPRGQNELKREIALLSNSEDADSRIKSWELKRFLLEGEATRKEQLKSLTQTQNFKKTFVKDALNSRNKNDTATAIVFNAILEATSDIESNVHISKPNFIEFSKEDMTLRVLCLPEKFQTVWDRLHLEEGYLVSDNPLEEVDVPEFTKILNDNLTFDNLSSEQTITVRDWLIAKIKSLEIDVIATVDRRTEMVTFLDPANILDYYAVNFKLSKRLGGTAQYRKSIDALAQALQGTLFENAEIVEIKDSNNTLSKIVLLGVPIQPEVERSVGNIYLSWRESSESDTAGYYEVRTKHESKNYDLKVVLSKHDLTQISDDLSYFLDLITAKV